ncbi:MAG: hypothetical protein ACYCZX_12565, partial [Rhodospirillaceae bacterium]
ESLVTATHALDRVLMWNHYHLLHYGPAADRYAYWNKLKHPEKFPMRGLGLAGDGIISTWWMDPAVAKANP